MEKPRPVVTIGTGPGGPTSPTERHLPADDPDLFGCSLADLERRWVEAAERPAIGAEAMAGVDRRAQARGVPGIRLMEHAGTAVAAVVHAFLSERRSPPDHSILVLSGGGNNGGDGFVAARQLARRGHRVVVGLISTGERPQALDAARNWDRLGAEHSVTRFHAGSARDVALLADGIARAAVVVDALLGTGVRDGLRDPIRAAVDLIGRARAAGVPIIAVDTPTAVDLTGGEPSDPVVTADITVTFHRPKLGLREGRGRRLAGRVFVAPIGIPAEADVA